MTRRDWTYVIVGWFIGDAVYGFLKGFVGAALEAKGCR